MVHKCKWTLIFANPCTIGIIFTIFTAFVAVKVIHLHPFQFYGKDYWRILSEQLGQFKAFNPPSLLLIF